MKKIIIILGMHRSGTSVLSQMCQYMGAYLGEEGELMAATESNPAGYFENNAIVHINNEILHYGNREWYNLEPIELDFRSPQIIIAMEKLKSVIGNLLEKNDIIAIKDPRTAVLMSLWDKILDELAVEVNYIWEFRNPLEVADSLRKRNGYSRKHSLLLWLYYNLSILNYLKGKDYLLINYRDILENSQVIYDLSQLFDKEIDQTLNKKFSYIIRTEYCHSEYSYQITRSMCNKLVSDMYGVLLKKKEQEAEVTVWIEQYMEEIIEVGDVYIDYKVLENKNYLKDKELIVYGAGDYGHQAARMLQQMGFMKFNFCDRDAKKYGMNIMGGKVFSIADLEQRDNLLFIIAVGNAEAKKEIEQTLAYIRGVEFLSFFALKTAWKYFTSDSTRVGFMTEALSYWYGYLNATAIRVRNACNHSILVYQCGKVGSCTVSESLREVGIENTHMHRFFGKSNYRFGAVILGDEQMDFIKKSSFFQFPEYVERVKNEMKGKKIITMVRDPIAVDLSTVFQWIETGHADRYFIEQLENGCNFLQAVLELMLKIQNKLFSWFEEELKELCDIDVFAYPFDCEKGYTIIEEQDVKILVLKTEKLSQMTEVIRDFTGSDQFELLNKNIGEDKEYVHLYKKVKENLVLPDEYVDFYYKGNDQVGHFYNKAEQKCMENKWRKVKKDINLSNKIEKNNR